MIRISSFGKSFISILILALSGSWIDGVWIGVFVTIIGIGLSKIVQAWIIILVLIFTSVLSIYFRWSTLRYLLNRSRRIRWRRLERTTRPEHRNNEGDRFTRFLNFNGSLSIKLRDLTKKINCVHVSTRREMQTVEWAGKVSANCLLLDGIYFISIAVSPFGSSSLSSRVGSHLITDAFIADGVCFGW